MNFRKPAARLAFPKSWRDGKVVPREPPHHCHLLIVETDPEVVSSIGVAHSVAMGTGPTPNTALLDALEKASLYLKLIKDEAEKYVRDEATKLRRMGDGNDETKDD